MRTTAAATGAPVVRKKKLLRRLIRCFANKKRSTSTEKQEMADILLCKEQQQGTDEDLTSVVSYTEDEDQSKHSSSSGSSRSSSSSSCDNDSIEPNYSSDFFDVNHNDDTSCAKISATLSRNDEDMATASSSFSSSNLWREYPKDQKQHIDPIKPELRHCMAENSHQMPTSPPVIPMLPLDVWREVFTYVHDPTTLCRLSCVSKDLNQRVQEASPLLWKGLYEHRWVRASSLAASTSSPSSSSNSNADGMNEEEDNDDQQDTKGAISSSVPSSSDEDWKKKFQRRFALEGHVARTMQQVVLLELEPDLHDFEMLQQRSYGRIASVCIEHDSWRRLLQDPAVSTTVPLDILCAMANGETSYHPTIARIFSNPRCLIQQHHPSRAQFKRRALLRFAAASTAFTFHCQEVITEMAQVWERSLYEQIMNPTFTTTPTTQVAYEETTVLLAHALRTIPNLLQRTSSLAQLQARVSQKLDSMTQVVRQHMSYYLDKRQKTKNDIMNSLNVDERVGCDMRELLFTIHYVMSKHYGIRSHVPVRFQGSGGDEDVLHACSIAHVLSVDDQDDQGTTTTTSYHHGAHPILVAIVYQAVARRMGLMGDILFCPHNCHTLLRFSSSSQLLFMDLVQDQGRIMTLPQCQDLIRSCRLMTEQDYSERRRRRPPPPPRGAFSSQRGGVANAGNDDEDDDDIMMDDMDEDLRTAFWSQPPMSIPSVVSWLATPFFAKQKCQGEEEEDQPYDFLLGQLVESSGGGGGRLVSFLQDRMVFFSSIMRHCKLIS